MSHIVILLALAGPLDVMPEGKKPADRRLTAVRTLNDKDFFFRAPATRAAWEERARAVREQILVATGLWPMPERTPVKAVVHGKVERDGYTIEKVFFASTPGHYVTGSLYRPAGDAKGKRPAILAAHGHWRDGRMHDAGAAEARAQVKIKAESNEAVARHFLQAICVQLARMGCVVFFYDMVGYADSTALGHAAFTGAEAELRLQSLMGLQTLNSIRALDFVCSLPDVDAERIGMTGASGGGTQTFILGAIDERIRAAVPAVMVSTAMQGGCVCENASHLRVGTGNVEFAALMAPRPLALTAANDWTLEVEKRGMPDLTAVYKLYGRPDLVQARCWPHFGHNYNQPAREYMYTFFNKHLSLGHEEPIREKVFTPEPPASLTVFTEAHPRPADSLPAARLLTRMAEASDRQMEALLPKAGEPMPRHREVLLPALRVLLGTSLPPRKEVEARATGPLAVPGATARGYLLSRRGAGEQVPAVVLKGKAFTGAVIVWVAPEGKASLLGEGKLHPAAAQALEKGAALVALDPYGTGELALEKPLAVNARMAGYTFGYNRTLLAQRCHDILTAAAFAQGLPDVKAVHLAGFGKAGPWVILARALAGDAVSRTAADVHRFRFDSVREASDEMMLPGALKYGGLGAFAALAAPHEMLLHNHQGSGTGKWLNASYAAAEAKAALSLSPTVKDDAEVVAWLLR
jgi:dienelactone hydrolase